MIKEKETLKGLTLQELRDLFISEGEPKYRAEQVFKWMYGDMVDDFNAVTKLEVELSDEK